ncbi:MAG: hypothetical protein RJQ08_13490 [Salinisphaeraceae bacterium]
MNKLLAYLRRRATERGQRYVEFQPPTTNNEAKDDATGTHV